jgi:RHS repeat-associated protein
MQKILTSAFALLFTASLFAQHEPIQPFEELGIKVKVLTLSNGKYQESFPNDTTFRFGSVMFNRVTGEVVTVIENDTLYGEYNLKAEVVSRWLSPDPLASEFSNWSPYSFVFNNPLIFVDPDGMAPDYIVDGDGNRLDIQVTDNQLVYGANVPQDVQTTLNGMWQTEAGQEMANHLLNTNSAVEVSVSENVGVGLGEDGKYRAMYGVTSPPGGKDEALITDKDGGKVYENNKITLFKGTFEYGTGDKSALENGKITVIDEKTGKDVSKEHAGKVNLEPSANPDKIYKTESQFYNLTGTHEAVHTTSANIKLQRRNKDAETPAYQKEDQSRSQLKN